MSKIYTRHIYGTENVLDAAKRRIGWLFDEFPNVTVPISGGKDSTVVMNLAAEIAEAKGRLPLRVFFIDQEVEFRSTIEYLRQVREDPRLDFHWLQVPFKLSNQANSEDPWLHCWGEGEKWLREREPGALTENIYGTDRFYPLFDAYLKHEFPDEPAVKLAGIRTEESPGRYKGVTGQVTYKGETWGSVANKKLSHFTMYPIYDWSYSDVWKAIHDHGWSYNPIYDYQYQYGIPVMQMRCSSVTHENSMNNLLYLQEAEPDTWNAMTERLMGVNTVGQLGKAFTTPPTELPPMFTSWREYRDYLVENLVTIEKDREYFRRTFARYDDLYGDACKADPKLDKFLLKLELQCVLTGDVFGQRLGLFRSTYGKLSKNAGSRNAKKAKQTEPA